MTESDRIQIRKIEPGTGLRGVFGIGKKPVYQAVRKVLCGGLLGSDILFEGEALSGNGFRRKAEKALGVKIPKLR